MSLYRNFAFSAVILIGPRGGCPTRKSGRGLPNPAADKSHNCVGRHADREPGTPAKLMLRIYLILPSLSYSRYARESLSVMCVNTCSDSQPSSHPSPVNLRSRNNDRAVVQTPNVCKYVHMHRYRVSIDVIFIWIMFTAYTTLTHFLSVLFV